MNQRDFLYIEDRLYGDVRLSEAASRLRMIGEDALAATAEALVKQQGDALTELRAALRDRQIASQP